MNSYILRDSSNFPLKVFEKKGRICEGIEYNQKSKEPTRGMFITRNRGGKQMPEKALTDLHQFGYLSERWDYVLGEQNYFFGGRHYSTSLRTSYVSQLCSGQ